MLENFKKLLRLKGVKYNILESTPVTIIEISFYDYANSQILGSLFTDNISLRGTSVYLQFFNG